MVRTASIARSKVVLIEPAEAMNHHTANSLLKSLEEPSGQTQLLLVSDGPSRLLPTIRSRCRHLRLRPPAWSEAREWLISRRGEQDSDDLLGIASGCPLSALRLGEGEALERFDRAAALLQRAARPGAWVSSLAAEASDIELRELLGWMQVYLVDLGRWLADPAASCLLRARSVHATL
ncbi:MAG: DNA polymerase III subunit delta', partial [Gammaproteobacteria bacterium]